MVDYPILLDDNNKPYAIFQNAFDVFLDDQVITDSNGAETLEFKIPYNDPKRLFLNNEDYIQCFGREFIVRTVEDDKSNSFYSTIFCEASWYSIDGEPIKFNLTTVSATDALNVILKDTGWSPGVIEITRKRSLKSDVPLNRLEAIRMLPILYECEMSFDTIGKKINLVDRVGEDTQILISYEKNTDSLKRTIDSRNVVTRLYLEGENGLNIKSVNNGFEYVENYSYYDELGKKRRIKPHFIKDERFNNPNALKEYGEKFLDIHCRPKYSYEVKVYLLNGMVNLGDSLIIYDKDLKLRGYMRVVKRRINVLQLEQTQLELENKIKNFSDQLVEGDVVGTSDTSVSETALSEVSMFNLLLNSRADYGFNYWLNRGFEIDNTVGVTGKASFKCVGEIGVEKTLEQIVDVSNRDSYAISAQVEIKDLVKGDNSEVGFEVVYEYEDGTTDTQFISII